ncbi:MAG: hypothetical protein AB7O68_12195 [Pirellulales bacterium]
MAEQPTRRWFRFKLSTVLILTAIAAWAVAYRPEVELFHDHQDGIRSVVRGPFRWHLRVAVAEMVSPARGDRGWAVGLNVPDGARWPLVALAALFVWKAAWAVRPHLGLHLKSGQSMAARPKRRWIQFRLSTWLLLVGIIGWTMALPPGLDFFHYRIATPHPWRVVKQPARWHVRFTVARFVSESHGDDGWGLGLNFPDGAQWPVAALATFLVGKTAWGAIERRRRRTRPNGANANSQAA